MYSNKNEHHSFFVNAFTLQGSATPRVFFRVLIMLLYAIPVTMIYNINPNISLSLGPFELFGLVLGLILVFRTNAGYDRWWEARKLWGGIVNQCRNLSYSLLCYSNQTEWKKDILKWIITYPYACRQSLSNDHSIQLIKKYFSSEDFSELEHAKHLPSYVMLKILELLYSAKNNQYIDNFVFLQLDKDRGLLVDYIGACERILKTPIPYVYAINVRRLILMFLIFLPFALLGKAGNLTPIFVAIVAYPLFSLDQIGVELQNPFSQNNLSHLPLADICATIESNINYASKLEDVSI